MAGITPVQTSLEAEYRSLCNLIRGQTSLFETELATLKQRIETDDRLRQGMENVGVRVRFPSSYTLSTQLKSTLHAIASKRTYLNCIIGKRSLTQC